VFAVYFVFDLE